MSNYTQKQIQELSYRVIGAAIEVHRQLGPGLLESVYQKCLAEEFRLRGIRFQSQASVPIEYKTIVLDEPLRMDFLIEGIIVLEIKSVELMAPIFTAQTLTYLKLAKKPKALLINFFTENIAKSVVSLVSEEFSKLLLE